jgi:hypothetical protein
MCSIRYPCRTRGLKLQTLLKITKFKLNYELRITLAQRGEAHYELLNLSHSFFNWYEL